MASSAGETLGPPSGAPRHFQHLTSRAEAVERGGDLRDFPIPLLSQVQSPVVAAAPLPPLVVLRRTSPVIRSLLREEFIVVHSRRRQMSMWYSRAALSNKMLCATESGTPAKFFSITVRELGHVESVWGKSDPHMKLSRPITS